MDTNNINSSPKNTYNNIKAEDIVSMVDDLLQKAVRYGASDIHFEPTGNSLNVKFRLDGVLNTIESIPKSFSDNVIARLKVLGGLLTYRNDIPQEGRIEIQNSQNGQITDQRLAVFPTIHGQRAVIRLFYKHQELMDLKQLGFPEQIYNSLKRIASQNMGVLLLTGPAGSGKSTTLAAILRHILRSNSFK